MFTNTFEKQIFVHSLLPISVRAISQELWSVDENLNVTRTEQMIFDDQSVLVKRSIYLDCIQSKYSIFEEFFYEIFSNFNDYPYFFEKYFSRRDFNEPAIAVIQFCCECFRGVN